MKPPSTMKTWHQFLRTWCILAFMVSLTTAFVWWEDYEEGNGYCPGFKCKNGDCILPELHCDGVADCVSGNDEDDCNFTCLMGDFQCDDGECIENDFRCDGVAHCLDYSDEANCENQTAIICQKDEMKCKNNLQCVASDSVCDGENDCADESDEESCPDFTCGGSQYQCTNTTHCIPNLWVCDGTLDCEDGSDEDCDLEVLKCKEFLCADKSKCLKLDAVCDGKNDCSDGSDERNDCYAKCQEENCASGCVPHENAIKCACGSGYVLQDDGKTCTDKNECAEEIDGAPTCSQICVNTVGSFDCVCHRPYVKEPDGRTCRLVPSPVLVVGSEHEIQLYDLHTRTVSESLHVSPSSLPVEDIDMDGISNRVFWIDAKTAQYIETRGTGLVIASNGLVALKAVSYDWSLDLVYLLDTYLGVIVTCNIMRDACATVVTGLAGREAEDMLIDPVGNFLYWTENAFPARIMRSYPDGESQVVFLQSPAVTDLDHLTMDYPTKMLYWMDRKRGTIYRIPVDTEEVGRTDLMQAVVTYIPQSSTFTVVEDRVIWWVQKSGKVMEENKFSGKERQPILQHSSRVTGLGILHPGLHPTDGEMGGSCGHLSHCDSVCARNGEREFTCLCPPGLKLVPGPRDTCHHTASYPALFIGSEEYIEMIPLYAIGQLNRRAVSIVDRYNVTTMATHPRTGQVFFSAVGRDGKLRVCKADPLRLFRYEADIEDRVEYLGEPRSLAVDWLVNQVFWLNAERKTVEIFKVDGSSHSSISFDVDEEIRSMTINVTKGLLFYSQWGILPKIVMCNMDGTNCRLLVNSGLKRPVHLVSYDDRLYWSDLGLEQIASVFVDGSGRMTHVRNKFIQAFAVHDMLFYWDNTTERIQLVEPTMKQVLTHYHVPGINIMDLTVFVPITEVPDLPCASNNGGCSDICLSLPDKHRRCMCPLGKKLGSDEQTCYVTQRVCSSGEEVYCASSDTCILKTDLCQELVTCRTLATEVVCSTADETETVDDAGECPDESYCEHLCALTSEGPVCYCDQGMTVAANSRNCTDIDECAVKNGACSQLCHNTKGSYYCSCVDGYTLISDKATCHAKDHDRAYLMVSTVRGIHRVEMDGEMDKAVVFSPIPPKTFDVFPFASVDTDSSGAPDSEEDMLVYVSPLGGNRTHSLIHKESQGTLIGTKTMEQIIEIRVDAVTRNIYLVSGDKLSYDITVCNEHIDNCVKIMEGKGWEPTCLTFHQARRQMYWIDKKKQAICKAYMNGYQKEHDDFVVSTKGNLFTLDVVRERLYWVEPSLQDSHSATLLTSDLSGGDRYTVESFSMKQFHSMDIYEGFLYLTDKASNTIQKVSTFSARPVLAEMRQMKYDIEDVRVVHTAPNIENPCTSTTCPSVCVLGELGASCLCPNKTSTGCDMPGKVTEKYQLFPQSPLHEGRNRFNTAAPKTLRGDSIPKEGQHDPCKNYCLNGGTCYPFGAIALCMCAEFYGGHRCSMRIEPDTTTVSDQDKGRNSTANNSSSDLTTVAQESSGISGGTVAGIIITVLLVVAVITAGLFIFWKKFRCEVAGRRLGGVGYSVRDDQTALVPASTVTDEFHYRKWDLDGNPLDTSSSSSDSAVYSNANSPATIFRPASLSSSS